MLAQKKANLKVSDPLNLLLLTSRSDLIDFMSCAIETFIMKKAIGDRQGIASSSSEVIEF